MKMEFSPLKNSDDSHPCGRHITAFTATRQDYGLHIQVAGCVYLQPAHNATKNVIGVVELDDQVVPILDARKEPTEEISDFACIVLFENLIGDTTIVTGRLYDSACQVFDLIVGYMDEPETPEHLYTPTEHHHLVGDSAK